MKMRDDSAPSAGGAVCERAWAKVNLLLSVGRLREDGYHDLVSVMQTVSFGDTIRLSAADSGGVTLQCAGVEVPCGAENLAVKAANTFFDKTGTSLPGLRITLEKAIPTQAGLGGGSADAAAVLRGLRRICAPDLPYSALEEMGMALGSDVPFCVRGGSAKVLGKGEVVLPLAPLPRAWFVLVKPDEAYSTAAMYQRIDKECLWESGDSVALENALRSGDLAGICRLMHNTFERCLLPDSQAPLIVRRLRALGADGAMLSGSGSAVFGVFSDELTAHAALTVLHHTYPNTFLATPVQRAE